MGSFLSNVLGADSTYQADPHQNGNIYQQSVLQQQLDQQGQLYGQQQNLASMLQNQAAGQGPNPAQIQYQQNVQQNNANAQGMLAAQRGLNPALAAQMGADLQARNNQQAAGQSGLMQAQQQIAAQNTLGGLYGQMAKNNLGQQQLYGNANEAAMRTNAGVASDNQKSGNEIFGGILGAAGSGLGIMKAHGGMIERFADGGQVAPLPASGSFQMPQFGSGLSMQQPSLMAPAQPAATDGPRSAAGQILKGFSGGYNGGQQGKSALTTGMTQFGEGVGKFAKNHSGSSTPDSDKLQMPQLGAGLSGNAPSLGVGQLTSNLARGGAVQKDFRVGGPVPGKAAVKGDSYSNDTVPAMVSPGEIVLPRSVTTSKDAPQKAAEFVAAVMAKRKHGKK